MTNDMPAQIWARKTTGSGILSTGNWVVMSADAGTRYVLPDALADEIIGARADAREQALLEAEAAALAVGHDQAAMIIRGLLTDPHQPSLPQMGLTDFVVVYRTPAGEHRETVALPWPGPAPTERVYVAGRWREVWAKWWRPGEIPEIWCTGPQGQSGIGGHN